MERRWERSGRPRPRLCEESSPPTGSSPSRATRSPAAPSRSRTTAGSPPSGPRRARRGRALRRLRDRPRVRQLPLAPRVRGLRRLRRRAAVLAVDRHPRRAQEDARPRRHARDRDGRRVRVPPLGDHDGRRLQLRGRRGRGRGRDRAARDRLPRGLRPRRLGARALRGAPRARRAPGLRPARARRLAARAVHVHARALRGMRGARAPAWRRTSPRASPSASSSSTAQATGRRSRDMLVPPPGRHGDPHARRRGPARPARSWRRTASTSDDEEIALLARHGVGRRALPALERVPRLRRRARSRSSAPRAIAVGIATDSPASTPSFDLFEELRTAIVAARARERRPDALTAADALELATLGGARVLGMDDEVGSLVPGKAGGHRGRLARRQPVRAC